MDVNPQLSLPRRLEQILIAVLALLGLLQTGACSTGKASDGYGSDEVSRWEEDIRALELEHRGATKGGVLFVGSSSIRLWESLEQDMAPVSVLRSGFGGARSADVLNFAERLVIPHAPSAIVFYAGDNDLGGSIHTKPDVVRDNFKQFVSTVRTAGLSPEFYFVSIKPSPQRAERWPTMRKANALVADYAEGDSQVNFVDVSSAMLDEYDNPRTELFTNDGLHMNERGYALWARTLKPILQSQVGPNPLYL